MDKDSEAIVIEAINTGLKDVGDKLGSQIAELNETATKILTPKPEDILTKEQVDAELEADALGGVTSMKVWDIPVGEALVGGFTAVFASELIDGFMINQQDWMKGAVKLVGAGVAVKWGGKLLGNTGAKALALLLAYDGIRSLIPIDTWAKSGADAITGMIPAGGLGGFQANSGGTVASTKVLEQATKVAADYYQKAEGR